MTKKDVCNSEHPPIVMRYHSGILRYRNARLNWWSMYPGILDYGLSILVYSLPGIGIKYMHPNIRACSGSTSIGKVQKHFPLYPSLTEPSIRRW